MEQDLPRSGHVADLGPVLVTDAGCTRPIRGRRANILLARLLVAGRAGTETPELIAAIWPTTSRPSTARQSLANTVAQLRNTFGTSLIETTPVGYRIGSAVTSDRHLFLENVASTEHALESDALTSLEAIDATLLRWRDEPWSDFNGDWVLDADRHRLRIAHERAEVIRAQALVRLGRHADAAEALAHLVQRTPFDESVWNDLAMSLAAVGRRTEALRAISRARSTLRTAGLDPGAALSATEYRLMNDAGPGAARSLVSPTPGRLVTSRSLNQTLALWEQDRRDDALQELHRCSDHLATDDIRRLDRCIRTVDRSDAWAHCMWRELVSLRDRLPGRAERALISLDAYALEHMTGGTEIAGNEAENADAVEAQVRALRVQFMAFIGRPGCAALQGIVARLASIDHDEASIEAARFQAVLAAKRGRFEDAIVLLAQYDDVVTALRPEWLDDFASLSLLVMKLCHAVDIEATASDLFPVLYNVYTVELVRLWERLQSAEPLDHLAESLTASVAATVPSDTALAIHAFRAWRSNSARTPRLMHELAEVMVNAPDHRYFQIVPVVLGRYAISTDDAPTASAVAARLEPWRSEQLGLWPLDLICGPASLLLDELALV